MIVGSQVKYESTLEAGGSEVGGTKQQKENKERMGSNALHSFCTIKWRVKLLKIRIVSKMLNT